MTEYMVIAPGEAFDRRWVEGRHYAFRFLRSAVDFTSFADDGDPLYPAPEIERATLRRYYSPSWRIRLTFYVHDRLGFPPTIPTGYVWPGWIEGLPLLARSCMACRREGPCGHEYRRHRSW
jgi:hypothetical protein